ncbi:hypothetical protein Syn7502_00389 [Synechococcus sp. PCC 7502]|nr:hypothetical protein Syn7502_00389 [Synechococcus sp. PCC 7502]
MVGDFLPSPYGLYRFLSDVEDLLAEQLKGEKSDRQTN